MGNHHHDRGRQQEAPIAYSHIAAREHDVTDQGNDLRVLVERFVEIAQAEEDNGAGKLFLDLEVVLAEGCGYQTQ